MITPAAAWDGGAAARAEVLAAEIAEAVGTAGPFEVQAREFPHPLQCKQRRRWIRVRAGQGIDGTARNQELRGKSRARERCLVRLLLLSVDANIAQFGVC